MIIMLSIQAIINFMILQKNCNGICKTCNTKNIHYGISNGSYIYYCLECDKDITKWDILENKPFTSQTLGELLESKNEIIKRNAMSILKTLNK